MPIQLRFHVAFVKNIVHYIASRGIDPERFCGLAGIPLAWLSEPDAEAGSPLMDRIWRVAVEESGDANLGLHLGEGIQPADIGIVGLAMMSCDTLRSALLKLVRYWDLLSNATRVEFRPGAGAATLELRIVDVPGNFIVRNRHPVESSFSACLSLLQVMVGRRIPLTDLAMIYPPPADPREHVRVFGRMPRFGAGENTMTFPVEALGWPMRYSNPAVMRTLEEQMERTARRNAATLNERLRLEVVRSLRAESPDLGSIASALGMSERAVQRELQAEGTTFRKVVDSLRKDLAAEYLAEDRHSIADISFFLGFAEPTVLHRYFRRWYGVTPATFRAMRAGRTPETASER